MGEPSGFGSRGESRRDDATGLTKGKEIVPAMGSDNAATIGSKKAGFEIKRPEEMTVGTREWNRGGPGDEFRRVGGSIWQNKLNGAKLHERAEREAIPLWPPSTQRVTHRLVGRRVQEQELDMERSQRWLRQHSRGRDQSWPSRRKPGTSVKFSMRE
jgi:hypothetical protein